MLIAPKKALPVLATLVALLALMVALLAPATSAARRHHRHRHHARHHAHRHHARHKQAPRTCANADTPATAASTRDIRRAVLCLVNQERTSRGLPALHARPALTRSAQLWTNALVSQGLFTHGADFAARITAAGYRWGYAGENIASGFRTARAVVKGWMGSEGHCRNILDPHFADIGTGVVTHPTGIANVGSTWTQDFGLPLGHAAPSNNTGPQSGCPY
jgi:uncharacterized protein YkwD